MTRAHDETPEPNTTRNPAILYGLGNLLENAADFAENTVNVVVDWNEKEVAVTIRDDGPGFSPEMLARLGEPYVRGRRPDREGGTSPGAGLGLGFFIAKTLLERTGAQISLANGTDPRGAVVRVEWDREDFEQPLPPQAETNPLRPVA